MSTGAPSRSDQQVWCDGHHLHPDGTRVQSDFGYALYVAQQGGLHRKSKPLKGFGGAGVVEIVNEHRGDTYRCIYTVRFAGSVYVLRAFQKKSKKGRETPKAEIELIRRRLREAERIAKGEQP